MPHKLMVWLLMSTVAVTLLGCPKKDPVAPPEEIQVDTTDMMDDEMDAPEEVVDEAPDMTEGDAQQDALPSDITELNRVLRERGLIGDVFFDTSEANLRDEARQRLSDNARWLRENPSYSVTLEGHADERDTNEYNLALGERRASTAKEYMSSLGVDGSRMRTLSYGEERPVCTESTEACWQRNRRVHFIVNR
jgi:peptidoglycan-associated lipoprotein